MLTRRATLSAGSFSDFGTLLRVLRRRARLTQRELGLAVGYGALRVARDHVRRLGSAGGGVVGDAERFLAESAHAS